MSSCLQTVVDFELLQAVNEEDALWRHKQEWDNAARFWFSLANGMVFQTIVVVAIIVAGILAGLQSYTQLEENKILELVDVVVLVIFIFEILFKILAEGRRPQVSQLG